jgi:hypothetical protein
MAFDIRHEHRRITGRRTPLGKNVQNIYKSAKKCKTFLSGTCHPAP